MSHSLRRAFVVLSLLLGVTLATAASGERVLRLRNERIVTSGAAARPTASAATELHGLWLVQFAGPPTPDQQDALAALGVELLNFVPDDAFIVRGRHVPIGAVRALPFVTWLGPYQAAHKLDARLGATAGRGANVGMDVRVLLAPRAEAGDRLALRGLFAAPPEEQALRFGTLLRGALPAARLTALAESPAVLWIEPAPRMKLRDEVSTKIVAGADGANATPAAVHQLGFTGAGVKVAVADSGLDSGDESDMHPDIAGRVSALFYYGALEDAADEHSHGTHCAGIIAGNGATGEVDANGFLYGLGVAPGASLIGQRLFDAGGGYTYTNASFEPLTRDAKRAGAEVGSNSWGDDTQGRYDLSAMEFDALVRDADTGTPGDQPYILEFSAGNAGPGEQTIGSPAVAKNVIATGASQNDRFDFLIYADGADTMADFSSRGPCEDGRIKPDVVAPGTWIASLRSVFANDDNAWGEISPNYMYQGGTSQAGPHVSGAAAVFVQFYRSNFAGATPSPALTKAALIHSAVDMDDFAGTDPVPNSVEGWGRVDLTSLIGSPRAFDVVDQTSALTNGALFERRVVVAGADEPLKLTLAYTDVPGLPAVIPALVNDLDLEVVAPNGDVYRGNQFLDGESVPNAASADPLNNVEGVRLTTPAPGEYLVRVRARRVVQDARTDVPGVNQDFALVTSGQLLATGQSIIYLDRPAYTAPGRIRVTVVDPDRAGQPTLPATLASLLQPAPLALTLTAAPGNGVFTGSVATALGPVAADGQLHIAHGNLITASYSDVSAGTTRTATAVADLLPPVITGVFATNRFGSTFVQWNTDEPADSTVRFATNATLAASATDATLVTQHELQLNGLLSSNRYFFAVSSADAAGNRATNNNAGANFSFIAAVPRPLLLVDAYAPFDQDDSPVIPVSEYTSALDQTGVDYDVWSVSDQGLPTLATLRGYQAVLWRINDSLWGGLTGYAGLTSGERALLTGYVTNGGALGMASMELLTRMGTSSDALAFRANILHVAAFREDNTNQLGQPLGVDGAIGYDGDSIAAGMGLLLDYNNYDSAFWQLISQPVNVADTITPTTNATAIFFDAATGLNCGVRYPRTGEDSVGRTVFLSFPLDAVPATGDLPDTRANLLRNLISFLVPGLNGVGTLALDRGAYRVPDQMVIEVADSDLVGAGTTTVQVASDTQTNGVTVTLNETVLRGQFRGQLTLVAATNAPAAGRLRVAHNDTVTVRYLDASAASLVLAEATVDTITPAISNIVNAPGYQECDVSWLTSEPTDGLVQFWEGTPALDINRTAYDAVPAAAHTVTLTGLKPDTIYFFQVVSRDVAGNTVTDNRTNLFHTFRTLKPLDPPFFDALETTATLTNWSILTSELSESGWTLGPPANGQTTNAHSPTRVWGSSRLGDNVSAIETYLVSPAFLLPTNGVPLLSFWHSYDFTERSEFDLLEYGELSIATNSAGPLLSLQYWTNGPSAGWENVTVNLNAYRGQVIYLVWTHLLFSLESAPRPGWLLDDFSLTLTNATTGTLIVTNNLWQAGFTLDGVARMGRVWTDANAAAGAHTLVFQPVPFYTTPTPQTNSLAAGGVLTFTGNYSFTDANGNGIADAWELARFGNVSPARTAQTDTDGDGVTDRAEFIAGTNPNDPLPAFAFTSAALSNGLLTASWTTAPGWSYRLWAGTNLAGWTPLSAWQAATGTNLSATVPLIGEARQFRAEATNTTGLPANLGLTVTPQPPGVLQFNWNAVGTRAYRLWSGTNLAAWTPASGWLQTNALTLPLPVGAQLYRLEVEP